MLLRIVDGTLKSDSRVRMLATGAEFDVVEIGYLRATGLEPAKELVAGEVGYLTASIKNVKDTAVGDTVTEAGVKVEPLPGYKDVVSMVFCGIYPVDGARYEDLKDALEKLHLNDAALLYEP